MRERKCVKKTDRRLLQQQCTRAYCTHVMGSPQRKWKIAEIPFRRTPVEGSDVGAWYRGRGSKGDGQKVQIKPHPSELCTKNVNYNRTPERPLSSGGGFFLMLCEFLFYFFIFQENTTVVSPNFGRPISFQFCFFSVLYQNKTRFVLFLFTTVKLLVFRVTIQKTVTVYLKQSAFKKKKPLPDRLVSKTDFFPISDEPDVTESRCKHNKMTRITNN